MTGEDPPADGGTDAATAAPDGTAADGGSTEEGTRGAGPPDDPHRNGDPDTGDAGSGDPEDPDRDRRADDGGGISDDIALAVSLLFGVALAVGSILLVSWLDPSFEGLLRVRPTVTGGGVGAGWTAGNADFWLNLMITLVHLADVVMGVFILLMVFVHWAAFRRLAARMQPPGGRPADRRAPATDGGAPGRPEDGSRSAESGERAPDGGDGGGGDRR